MTESGALYRLQSWLSPSYPVGAFSYSHGLEFAVETGAVHDAETLGEWVETVLTVGTGRIDGALFRAAYEAVAAHDGARLDDVVELGAAFQPSAEIALESLNQGDAFLRTCRAAWPDRALNRLPESDVAYPVAIASVCAAHKIPAEPALIAYFHAMAANLISAGVRLIPLGQTDGQKTLARVEPAVMEAALRASTVPLDEIGTAAPLLDLSSMLHETQYTRLFRS